MDMPKVRNTTAAEIMQNVARFKDLKGSENAFIDSNLPGCRRKKINIIGNGVVERNDDPNLLPNIPLSASGFNLGMIQCEHGNGTALHNHKTEEVFMPLVGPWVVTFMTAEGQQEIVLEPFDTVHIPTGIYRGFRYVGEGRGSLLTIIGGPDAGKVDWIAEVYEKASKEGLVRDKSGNLVNKVAQ